MPDSCPTWDLNDLYAGTDYPQLKADLATAIADSAQLAKIWQGKIALASGPDLAGVIAEF